MGPKDSIVIGEFIALSLLFMEKMANKEGWSKILSEIDIFRKKVIKLNSKKNKNE